MAPGDRRCRVGSYSEQHALLELRPAPLHLRAREGSRSRLFTAAGTLCRRWQRSPACQQTHLAAKLDKASAHPDPDGTAMSFQSATRACLWSGTEAAEEPHHLDVAAGLAFRAAGFDCTRLRYP